MPEVGSSTQPQNKAPEYELTAESEILALKRQLRESQQRCSALEAEKQELLAINFTVKNITSSDKSMMVVCGVKPLIFNILLERVRNDMPKSNKIAPDMGLLLLLFSVHRNPPLEMIKILTGIALCTLIDLSSVCTIQD